MPFVYCFSEIVVVFSPIKTKKEDLISLILDGSNLYENLFFFYNWGVRGEVCIII